MRHTAELVFLDIGNCPNVEVKDRKKLGQDASEERGSTFHGNQDVRRRPDLRALGNCHTVAC